MDLSFISIKKVLPNILNFVNSDNFEIVSLIKPQFEAGKTEVGKNGVVKDKRIHLEIINNIIEYCRELNLYPKNLTYSPIKGPKGNIEYLIYLTNKDEKIKINADEIVNKAHENLTD